MTLQITFDANKPSRLAHFWAEALPGYHVRDYDAAELARLAAKGLTAATDDAVAVDGPGPTLWFQISDSKTTTRNRIHFDLAYGPRQQERNRLIALGAAAVAERADHTLMQDPEGNQFCLFDPKV